MLANEFNAVSECKIETIIIKKEDEKQKEKCDGDAASPLAEYDLLEITNLELIMHISISMETAEGEMTVLSIQPLEIVRESITALAITKGTQFLR